MGLPISSIETPVAKQVRAILALGADGKVTKANLQARRAFGLDEDLEGKDLGGVVAEILSHQKAPRAQVLLAFADKESAEQVLLVLSDGHPPGLRVVPGAQATGQIASGPTEEPPAEELGEFIAHELRNDLAIILGLARLVTTSADSINERDRLAAVKGIQTEAEHAELVLNGILRLAEHRARPDLPTSTIPVHAVLERTIDSHSKRHPGRRFVLSGDSPVFAVANSTWLELAFLNLLSNAEKVTPPDQPIEVSLTQEGNHCIILVLDQGQALPPDLYSALWSIRTEGPPAGVEVTGSGIGLSLCKSLVEAMGGRVWAGPRPNRGSAFTLNLPLPEQPTDLEFIAAA